MTGNPCILVNLYHFLVLALGKIGWDTLLRRVLRAVPDAMPRPRPAFGHGAEVQLPVRAGGSPIAVLGCYHPSQQNTLTGRLTRSMLDDMVGRAVAAAASTRDR